MATRNRLRLEARLARIRIRNRQRPRYAQVTTTRYGCIFGNGTTISTSDSRSIIRARDRDLNVLRRTIRRLDR